jgi:hypothetical protein
MRAETAEAACGPTAAAAEPFNGIQQRSSVFSIMIIGG